MKRSFGCRNIPSSTIHDASDACSMKTYPLLRVQFVSYVIFWTFCVATHVAAVQPREIVGIWRDRNGATTELRGDGTYISHFADEYGTGTWRLDEGVLLTFQWYLAYWNKTSR